MSEAKADNVTPLPNLPKPAKRRAADVLQRLIEGKEKPRDRHTALILDRALQAEKQQAQINQNLQMLRNQVSQLERASTEMAGRINGYSADLLALIEMDEEGPPSTEPAMTNDQARAESGLPASEPPATT